MAKQPSERTLTPQVPGAAPVEPVAQPEGPAAPEGLADALKLKTNEDLIAMDAEEREGDNRPAVLAVIEAELQARIASLKPAVAALHPSEQPRVDPAPAASAPEEAPSALPHAADIDPAAITQPVLCQEGWMVPSKPAPPPIR